MYDLRNHKYYRTYDYEDKVDKKQYLLNNLKSKIIFSKLGKKENRSTVRNKVHLSNVMYFVYFIMLYNSAIIRTVQGLSLYRYSIVLYLY